MGSIVFKPFPTWSHYSATFALAHSLRRREHDVYYTGVNLFGPYVRMQGLSHHDDPAESALFPFMKPMGGLPKVREKFVPQQGSFARTSHHLRRFLSTLEAPLLLLDVHYVRHPLPLFPKSQKIGVFITKMPLEQDANRPPLNSGHIPTGSLLSRIYCACAWKRLHILRRISQLGGRTRFPTIQHLAAWGYRYLPAASAVDTRRLLFPRVCGIPEFVLAPKELDFKPFIGTNQYCINGPFDIHRNEIYSDYMYIQIIDQLSAMRSRGKLLVYCTLGTLYWQYKAAIAFVRRLCAASDGKDWNVVIAMDPQCRQWVGSHPPNVFIFSFVPQLDVLRRADIVITHGGMNTIREAIVCRVPLLVYPASRKADQFGNAARVVFHGLGLAGDMIHDSAEAIAVKIRHVARSDAFKDAVERMADRIGRSEAVVHGAEQLERVCMSANPP